jgi:hypothetical protein
MVGEWGGVGEPKAGSLPRLPSPRCVSNGGSRLGRLDSGLPWNVYRLFFSSFQQTLGRHMRKSCNAERF